MTRYLTKPRPGKKQTPEKTAAQSDRSIEESSSLPETDRSRSKRGKTQAPVEEVFEASSFSSDSEPDSLRELTVTTKPKRGKPQAPVEEDVQSRSFSSSDEPSSLADLGSSAHDEPSRQSRVNAAETLNRDVPRPSAEDSIASRSRSASMRRSMPASMGAAAPPSNRPSTQSRRKSNSPVRRVQQKVYEEIRRLQNGTQLVIPKLPFSRVIREVLQEYSCKDMRVTAECLKCLQEASEIYLTQLMEDGWRCTRHRDRATLTPKDLRLVLMLRNDSVSM